MWRQRTTRRFSSPPTEWKLRKPPRLALGFTITSDHPLTPPPVVSPGPATCISTSIGPPPPHRSPPTAGTKWLPPFRCHDPASSPSPFLLHGRIQPRGDDCLRRRACHTD